MLFAFAMASFHFRTKLDVVWRHGLSGGGGARPGSDRRPKHRAQGKVVTVTPGVVTVITVVTRPSRGNIFVNADYWTATYTRVYVTDFTFQFL